MSLFEIIAALVALTAVFAYVNYRLIRLPMTIGVMLLAMLCSLGLLGIGHFYPRLAEQAARLLHQINFEHVVLDGLLALMLFAGSLHIDLSKLRENGWTILLLSTLGVLLSTFLVGSATWLLFKLLKVDLPLIHCVLLGALIAPTDPIAVLGIMRTANASPALQMQVSGESLFNDGIGVAVFLALLQIARGQAVGVLNVTILVIVKSTGAVALGIALGWIVYLMLRRIDRYDIEVLLTLSLSMGVYALAERLHVSAPIATVVAGLIIGSRGRKYAMSERTRENLDLFWSMIDEFLNGVLFLLIGLGMLVIPIGHALLIAIACFIPIILISRLASVCAIILPLRKFRRFERGTLAILTWAGLRGGISVALALSLPEEMNRRTLVALTYGAVVFSILVQGMTVGPLVKHFARKNQNAPALSSPATG